MSLTLKVVERIHGHVAWLSIAALLHPVIVLRTPTRRAVVACTLSTALTTVTSILGVLLYPDYRRIVKQPLFLEAPRLGWMFERKEHLAAGAVMLAWAGLLAHLGSRGADDEAIRSAFARASRAAYAGAFVLAAIAGVLGVAVASHRTF